jgi:uncharacterized membrane protein SirB2
MLAFYLPIKFLHICAVALSGSLFALRGAAALAGARWPHIAWVRYASYTIDSVLLIAALALITMLPAGLFANHWLTIKLALIVAYIVLGTFALRRARTLSVRLVCYLCALVVFALVIGIALAHHPMGWWWLTHHPVRA